MSAASGSSELRQRKGGVKRTELSVIVPTYNETENIRPLCERLFKATKAAGLDTELLILDDESVGSAETEKIAKELKDGGFNVRFCGRKKSEGRGLSSAVLLGFKLATHSTILCMDADLQHEPESVPAVARPVLEGNAEFTVGSRHCAGGGLGFEWSAFRQLVSKVATLLAWFVAASTDPMSGFFCTRKEVLERGLPTINPIGFKIGLEIMARCKASPVQDVAITFQERNAGESKLETKQMILYVEQLAHLYWAKFGVLLVFALLFLVALGLYVLRAAAGAVLR